MQRERKGLVPQLLTQPPDPSAGPRAAPLGDAVNLPVSSPLCERNPPQPHRFNVFVLKIQDNKNQSLADAKVTWIESEKQGDVVKAKLHSEVSRSRFIATKYSQCDLHT